MLSELHIREFALIEDVRLELAGGMTVFSGETGAGKSILVDAMGAAFGARANSHWVRHGALKADVTAVLRETPAAVHELLQESDIEVGDELLLRRVIRADGVSRAYVNGVPVPAALLRRIGEACLEMHGQHEHEALLHADFQRHLLDRGLDAGLPAAVAAAWQRWHDEQKALRTLLEERERGVREEAWMREELARLRALELKEGLQAELEAKVASRRHFAQIQEAVAHVLDVLEGEETGARALLASCLHELSRVSDYSRIVRENIDLLGQADAILGETTTALRALADEAFDSASLAALESRLLDLHEAMRRNRTDECGLMALQDDLEARINRLDTGAWDEEAQKRRIQEAASGYVATARKLSAARKQAARRLLQEMRPLLEALALGGMRLRIDIDACEGDESAWSVHGFDRISWLAASNPGEPFRELAAVASGGELSRLVLALKGCGAFSGAARIAVFDEIDVGIGGETAWSVGRLLADMGRERQVLVVSHLPQVAACADRQWRITKRRKGSRTVTEVALLNDEERREEIARMLGGADQKSRDHAGQMLERGMGGL